ncbi:sensor histidine kinase [Caldimonas tepidiphila]|uniref:sensor histidine kinase n=1 Tax=Caldimonas tepidiphila TaxID=2315841 RepID=UPI000E5C303A|nr:HAMP domain-containing sensor histidine kinase [Caldimonas tepidiphila]
MKNLYLRIYLTVVAVLLLFALAAGWLFERNIEHEREQGRAAWSERLVAWGELAENTLPPASAPLAQQRHALLEWAERLRLPLALDAAGGRRIATSPAFERLAAEGRRVWTLPLSDGRMLLFVRPGPWRGPRPDGAAAGGRGEGPSEGWRGPERRPLEVPPPPWFLRGGGLAMALLALFVAVAAGAWPVVRRLTRELEALRRGVETFGAGELAHRVPVHGRDEVAALASSFNAAAARIEALVQSHRQLLANASHELRSPLARLKMALAMLDDASPARREALRREIETDIRELDALVEEVLLASRLDAGAQLERRDPVALLPLVVEESARFDAMAGGEDLETSGDERLLRRAVRNLLENARRYGGSEPPEVEVRRAGERLQVRVCDRGPGVPESQRERIFEPFYRLPGHAEHAGGVGLGLSLVKQIAERHGGSVHCEASEGGGSCFVISLPLRAAD